MNTGQKAKTLLGPGDPLPVEIVNQSSAVPLLLTCDHAGRAIPAVLEQVHLTEELSDSHIAYDIGAEGLAARLAHCLGATLIVQRYSRLVIDCNRPFDAPDCIAAVSDGNPIPGNERLRQADRERRYAEIHQPYHQTISGLLDARCKNPVVLVSIHSFTPRMNNIERPWHAGLLYNRDDRIARLLMQLLGRHGLTIAYNEPYSVDDWSDYTIPVHGEGRAIPHIMIEVRNDELGDDAGQNLWAGYIGAALKTIIARLDAIVEAPVP